MRIEEKISQYLREDGPISKEGALKFVFKLPKEGEFTAEFLDGTKTTITVDPEDKCAGKYAMISKDSGKPMECWNKKPSKEAAHQRLKELKFFGQ